MALTENTAIEASTPIARPKGYLKIPIIFTLTSFIGASLLFIVEPLIAKILLPEFGGSSSVWTLSTFFFQAIMLVGYMFIHLTSKFGPRRQPFWQLALVIPALIFLPLSLPAMEGIPTQEPFTRILLTLLILVGLPFLVISTTGPLIQKWYSWTNGPRSDDPYFIYAASNAGSFLGLLAYPFVIEPFLSLETQRNVWSIGFAAFLLMVGFCGFIVFKQNGKVASEALKASVEKLSNVAEVAIEKLSLKRQFWWIFLAFIPASLQLGLVSHITTDVASFPLLWIIPLMIYLATMIAAFARKSRKPPRWAIIGGSLFTIASIYLALSGQPASPFFVMTTMSLFMVTLALVSYAAHGSLAADRPETQYLTKYFVLISLGGAIGGAFNGLIAPFLFKTPLEFPMVLGLSLLMTIVFLRDKAHKYAVMVLILLLSFAIPATDGFNSNNVGKISAGRSFYGAWVVQDKVNGNKEIIRQFSHGTTIHGAQFRSEEKRSIPTSYYALGGPLSNIVDETLRQKDPKITVIGLGSGAMAAYANEDTTMKFIDVDKQVIEVAENPEIFTYLSDARKRGATVETILGDGRKMAEELEDGSQDLIAIDAFSSDSIPVHMLTEEAFATYESKLKPGGILAVHISNRVFDLEPVVANNAEKIGFEVLTKTGSGKPEADPYDATWMALTKDSITVKNLKAVPSPPLLDVGPPSEKPIEKWVETPKDKMLSWTDDHSSILEAIAR